MMNNWLVKSVVAAVTITAAIAPRAAQAVVFAQHIGDADPTTEGWTLQGGSDAGQSRGPVDDSGTPAWFVDDASTTASSNYFRALSPAEVATANGSPSGWTLR